MKVRSDNFHIWTFAHTLVPKTNAQTSNVNPLMPKEKKKKKKMLQNKRQGWLIWFC